MDHAHDGLHRQVPTDEAIPATQAASRKEEEMKVDTVNIDMTLLGARLANADDFEQAAFFHGLASELQAHAGDLHRLWEAPTATRPRPPRQGIRPGLARVMFS